MIYMLFFYAYNVRSTGSRALVNSLTIPLSLKYFVVTQLESYYKKLLRKNY